VVRRPFSLAGRFAALGAAMLAAYGTLVWLIGRYGSESLELIGLPGVEPAAWVTFLVAFAVVLPLAVWAAKRALDPLVSSLRVLSDGIRAFRDRDFSMRLRVDRSDEIGDLLRLYNRVGEILQDERAHIRQRELLLQTALDQSPIAIVLTNPLDRVLYANAEARRAFLGEQRLEGRHFAEILEACPPALRQVAASGTDGIFTVDAEEGPETYHLAVRHFTINRQAHTLHLLRRMTAELARQEVQIWKKVIRVISHELNNSLAPISSLAHSGRKIALAAGEAQRFEPIFHSIRERVDHLAGFLEGYARFARLPQPHKQAVEWESWLAALRELYAFRISGELPRVPASFDPSQMQQVLINLLKNAVEASNGDPDIAVAVDRLPDGRFRMRVMDRGRGMTDDVMRHALLPFYSTKPAGAGVGLPLCREIIEAHGGFLRVRNRRGGGTEVTLWLPP
jgi:nitrogen fixation/metabolism regulation signal transduction histidine kinase